MKVFVYGTLMEGFGNHGRIATAEFLGNATLPNHIMFSLGAFPAIRNWPGYVVHGEVYEVNSEQLSSMDQLEGHPSFYRRTVSTAQIGEKQVRCFVYVLADPCDDRETVAGGCWRSHCESRRII